MAAPIKRHPDAGGNGQTVDSRRFLLDFFRLALVLVAGAPEEEQNTTANDAQTRRRWRRGHTVDPFFKVVIVTSL